MYRVKASALNLRAGPGTNHPILRSMPRGEVVTTEENGFALVKAGDVVGWAAKDYLQVEPDPDLPQWAESPWLSIAREELGVSERPGADHNPRIIEYHQATTLRSTADEVPWCAAFVCWCLERAGVESTRSAAARSYLSWGRPIAKPEIGCVTVLSRGKNPVSGHVGFFVAETPTGIRLLGGNQGDRVSEEWYPRRRLLGYRMPLR